MSGIVNTCAKAYLCKEYAEKGITKCEKCTDSIPKKSLFKPKKVE